MWVRGGRSCSPSWPCAWPCAQHAWRELYSPARALRRHSQRTLDSSSQPRTRKRQPPPGLLPAGQDPPSVHTPQSHLTAGPGLNQALFHRFLMRSEWSALLIQSHHFELATDSTAHWRPGVLAPPMRHVSTMQSDCATVLSCLTTCTRRPLTIGTKH